MKKPLKDSVDVAVKVTPKAGRSEIIGWEEGVLRVRVAAVPEKGEANAELVRLMAKACGVSKSQVQVVSGETSRHKRLRISGIEALPF